MGHSSNYDHLLRINKQMRASYADGEIESRVTEGISCSDRYCEYLFRHNEKQLYCDTRLICASAMCEHHFGSAVVRVKGACTVCKIEKKVRWRK